MSVLVLGGAGYIGSHTVYALIEKGEDVVIVDNLQTGFKQLIHPKAKFYQGDLRDKEFLNSVFEKEDIKGVIHFAANSLVGVSMKEPLEYYNNNVYGMICLLEVMKEHGVKYFAELRSSYSINILFFHLLRPLMVSLNIFQSLKVMKQILQIPTGKQN